MWNEPDIPLMCECNQVLLEICILSGHDASRRFIQSLPILEFPTFLPQFPESVYEAWRNGHEKNNRDQMDG
jgi:hypothetical protein